MNDKFLGIDVGGTRIKGGMVDVDRGELIGEKKEIRTPETRTPEDISEAILEIIKSFGQQGRPVGIGIPAVVKDGIALTASNIDKSWIDFPVNAFLEDKIGAPVTVINDADAAGISEMTFGYGKNAKGTVILLTLGTGIGSAIFKDGLLLKNTELGQLKYKDHIGEYYASNSARKRENMDWNTYGEALNGYLRYVNSLLYPDLIILGGGISMMLDEYRHRLDPSLSIVAAEKLNNAGVIGAALGWKLYGQKRKGSE